MSFRKDQNAKHEKASSVRYLQTDRGLPSVRTSVPSSDSCPAVRGQRSTTTTGAVSVVKNIPEVNAMLWRVKHVIRIDPITFPDGQPTKDDLDGWQLLEVSTPSGEVLGLCKRMF